MNFPKISKETYIQLRKNLTSNLPEGSAVILVANDIMPTNADGTMPYVPNKDIVYLTGVEQEETVLILFPDAVQPHMREILILRETNEQIARWEGEKLNKDQARELTGIQNIQWKSQLPRILKEVMAEAEYIFLNTNEHLRRDSQVNSAEHRFALQLREEYPLHQYRRLQPVLQYARSIKHPEEIAVMKKAAEINTSAYARILRFIKPGVTEYQLQAEFIHEYLNLGASGFSYEPIVATGANACILHYIKNSDTVKQGDLILFDVGCWYRHYASDVTRCFPANGKFTEKQREIYNAVLYVQKEAFKMLRPGVMLFDYHKKVGALMTEVLIDLKLITRQEVQTEDPEWPAYKKYFMHGTSHFLGLDVHDVGLWHRPVEAGMVFTVEPGIYIPEEGLGIRIEDNILITADGYENFTSGIPKEIDEIEAAMA
ncbi:MAG: aminopeptidase P N-terminal domain-containing protein [Thermaurantimonas sp.]